MAFSYDGSGLPQLGTYERALTFYNNAQPFRDNPSRRKLDGRKQQVHISQLHDGAIACTLHHTDVVIYKPDNTLVINGYPSASTDEFAGSLLRATNLSPDFNRGMCMWVGERGYNARGGLKLQLVETRHGVADYALAADYKAEPWVVRAVNRKRAAIARAESNFNNWKAWVEMLALYPELVEYTPKWFTPYSKLALIVANERDQWFDTLNMSNRYGLEVASTINDVRKVLYEQYKVYDNQEIAYFEGRVEFERWKRQP